jgi:hypothetical protein
MRIKNYLYWLISLQKKDSSNYSLPGKPISEAGFREGQRKQDGNLYETKGMGRKV